jgi:hypothetical protein
MLSFVFAGLHHCGQKSGGFALSFSPPSKTYEEWNSIAFFEAEENPLVAFLMSDDNITVNPWSFFNKSNTLMSYVNHTLPKGSVLSDGLLKQGTGDPRPQIRR